MRHLETFLDRLSEAEFWELKDQHAQRQHALETRHECFTPSGSLLGRYMVAQAQDEKERGGKAQVESYSMQGTPSFPDGPPDDERYPGWQSRIMFDADCREYASEWRLAYWHTGTCTTNDCPQCFPAPLLETSAPVGERQSAD